MATFSRIALVRCLEETGAGCGTRTVHNKYNDCGEIIKNASSISRERFLHWMRLEIIGASCYVFLTYAVLLGIEQPPALFYRPSETAYRALVPRFSLCLVGHPTSIFL